MRIERIRGEKLLRMLGNIKRLQTTEAALQDPACRKGWLLPIDDDFADRLMRSFTEGSHGPHPFAPAALASSISRI